MNAQGFEDLSPRVGMIGSSMDLTFVCGVLYTVESFLEIVQVYFIHGPQNMNQHYTS